MSKSNVNWTKYDWEKGWYTGCWYLNSPMKLWSNRYNSIIILIKVDIQYNSIVCNVTFLCYDQKLQSIHVFCELTLDIMCLSPSLGPSVYHILHKKLKQFVLWKVGKFCPRHSTLCIMGQINDCLYVSFSCMWPLKCALYCEIAVCV